MKKMSCDLETRSGADITKTGVYPYAEDPNYDILLFGVSVDDGPVQVYDLACGDVLPDEIISALVDESVMKYAYNAQFERVCLSVWLRRNYPDRFKGYEGLEYLNPISWRCTMVLAMYNGLPLSLEMAGAVLGLEEQKLKEGKDLIRYFCSPCKPTASNGGRTWNLPEHAPEKWELFKKYNMRDVQVEMQIQKRLRNYPVPDEVWQQYWLDQRINDMGIRVDKTLVEQAIRIDELSKSALTERLKSITGLENPNSVVQLKGYLAEHGVQAESLGKKDVAALLKTVPEELSEVLSLRLKIAKSSVKKYLAMENTVCADGRCHGLFQFYGANRTGRWSGRLIQLQNLPQNHMTDLEQARELVREGDYEMLDALYDSVPGVLSELIRTSFIPRDGYKFIVSDFSAIEARVLSFLAGEKWRIDLFHNGGDIYCQSASQMFHVPVEKHGVNSHLRQKGKIAELACIAEGQLVLTNHGEKPIETITLDDLLWDGENWVHHDGVIFKGVREVITYEGLTATTDHLVWVEGESEPVYFGVAATCGAHLIQTGNGGKPVRLGNNNQSGKEMERGDEPLLCSDAMHEMWSGSVAESEQPHQREIEGMPDVLSAQEDSQMARSQADGCKAEVRKSLRSRISELWRERYSIRISKRYGRWAVPDRQVRDSGQNNGAGQDQYERKLCTGESAVLYSAREPDEQAEHSSQQVCAGILAVCETGCYSETLARIIQGGDHPGCGTGCDPEEEELVDHQRTARLYDIRNAGKHHRFTVSGHLVHNCGYGGSIGALTAMGGADMGLSEEEMRSLVDLWRESNPRIVQYWWDVDNAVKTAIRLRIPQHVGNISFNVAHGMMFITLPSGRKLAYVKPALGENRFGGESVVYWGLDASKHWGKVESWGPKFTENIVQAVSRDILAYAMQTLSCYRIVGHVHDEVIMEVPMETSLDEVCEQMGRTPPWLPGIELRADGYECQFYQKQ